MTGSRRARLAVATLGVLLVACTTSAATGPSASPDGGSTGATTGPGAPAGTPAHAPSELPLPTLPPTCTLPSPAPGGPSEAPAPEASAQGSAEPPIGIGPGATLPPDVVRWPDSVVSSTIALAALDNEIKLAGADLIVAAQNQDMRLFLGASDGLAELARESIPNAQRLLVWDDTRATGQAYLPVLCAMEDAATALGDGLRAGDGAAVTASSGLLASVIEQYQGIRSDLVELANIALVMKRGQLVK